MTLIPIRVLAPDLENPAFDEDSKVYLNFIRSSLRTTFYYLFEKFNVTEIDMNCTIMELGLHRGSKILSALAENRADTSFYTFVPRYLPENVTISGELVNDYECNLITFPKLRQQTEDSTSWSFLNLLFKGPQTILFYIIVFIINLIWWSRESLSFTRIHWEIMKIAYRQRFKRPKYFPLRASIMSFSLGMTIYQAIVVALIDTEKISIARFPEVRTFKNVYDQGLHPLIESVSGCGSTIDNQPIFMQGYLVRNNLLAGKESYSMINNILVSKLLNSSDSDRVVVLRSSITWKNFKQGTCTIYPNLFDNNPPYISPALENQLHPLLMSKNFTSYGQERLKIYVSTLKEQGLKGKKGIFSNSHMKPSDQKCLHARPQHKRKKLSAMGFNFYQPLLIMLMIASAMSTLIFMFENLFPNSQCF